MWGSPKALNPGPGLPRPDWCVSPTGKRPPAQPLPCSTSVLTCRHSALALPSWGALSGQVGSDLRAGPCFCAQLGLIRKQIGVMCEADEIPEFSYS